MCTREHSRGLGLGKPRMQALWLCPWLLCGAVACSGELNEAANGVNANVPGGYALPETDALAADAPPGGVPTAQAPISAGATSPSSQGGGVNGPVTIATSAGYSELPNGRGGINLEQVAYPATMGFDLNASAAAFETTVYPILRTNCAGCHSSEGRAQAPMHADGNLELAHAYALTRVNLRHPERSKLVERMTIDRHNCFGRSCSSAGDEMLTAVTAWADAVQSSLPIVPRGVEAGVTVSDAEVVEWVTADRATLSQQDAPYARYASLHELHNAGVAADELNVARAGLSKALNATARWATEVVNPADVNGRGLLYRFDIRDYWGYNKGVTELVYGGSDDDIFFGDHTDVLRHRFHFSPNISPDAAFAERIWARIEQGSVDAYRQNGETTNVDGFKDAYVEATQLVYTLSRPDVYHAIMSIPIYATELEDELGVVKDDDVASYNYAVVQEAITIDSRMVARGRTRTGGFYYKTFDIFSGNGQVFPFWEHPVPKFISTAGSRPSDLSMVATLLQPVSGEGSPECEASGGGGFTLCTQYTGEGGVQQSASEIIWDMPNGLHGYAIYGGLNQRRVDAFTFIVRDPRRLTSSMSDREATRASFGFSDVRLHVGGSCMSCHIDGMNRLNNDLREYLDSGSLEASWVGDPNMETQVRSLYPPTEELRPVIEEDRRSFFDAMATIRGGMMLGDDKNLHVEPIVWSFEWAQTHYGYKNTTSN